ncbi:DNA phosphorothioation system sulfurtransferase DndC [Desulfolutivibrio sp.]|uniref:DNA phosphorothioation system sulfurtransferase DndC n=1 Tax=Desulfolutivibrio sp. TaxID=2773296 RepID=UPI002F963381
MTTDNQALSVFEAMGFKKTISILLKEIRELYLENDLPWVVGYSGGKDSTVVLQLIWEALSNLNEDVRCRKQVYVISTDTLVENPIVSNWVSRSLQMMNETAKKTKIPISAHQLRPEVENSFWVQLLGKGYPAPRPLFRWCTERLKIWPSNKFIYNVVNKYGEAILAIGTRKAESQIRARTMVKHERSRTRDRLSPNGSIPNCTIYTPIEDWTNDDVWLFITRTENPWGLGPTELLELYKDATLDRECPLVVDKSTPSCGASRFGCWVCTLVARDKSMEAMIANDPQNEWLKPLTTFRDLLDVNNDDHLRDFRRMSGRVQLHKDGPIHGPYLQHVRENFLRKLLQTQEQLRSNAPEGYHDIELISQEELKTIRRIWILEKHELEDSLPRIYEDVVKKIFVDDADYYHCFGFAEMKLLQEVCGDDRLRFELIRELLDLEWQNRNQVRRVGFLDQFESAFKKTFYDDELDAVAFARHKHELLGKVSEEISDELTDL